jgi:hypothetical protein
VYCWQDIKRYKKGAIGPFATREKLKYQAEKIVEKYFNGSSSLWEINLPKKEIDLIRQRIQRGEVDGTLFDEVQADVGANLCDIYGRLIATQPFKEFKLSQELENALLEVDSRSLLESPKLKSLMEKVSSNMLLMVTPRGPSSTPPFSLQRKPESKLSQQPTETEMQQFSDSDQLPAVKDRLSSEEHQQPDPTITTTTTTTTLQQLLPSFSSVERREILLDQRESSSSSRNNSPQMMATVVDHLQQQQLEQQLLPIPVEDPGQPMSFLVEGRLLEEAKLTILNQMLLLPIETVEDLILEGTAVL